MPGYRTLWCNGNNFVIDAISIISIYALFPTLKMRIKHELRMFYEQLFKKTICNTNSEIVSFLFRVSLPVINNDFFNLCENNLTEDELLNSLKNMQNKKLPNVKLLLS